MQERIEMNVTQTCRSLPLRCVMWSHSCSASSDMKFATTAVSAAAAGCASSEEPPPAEGAAAGPTELVTKSSESFCHYAN